METRYWVYVYKKKLDQPRRNYKKKGIQIQFEEHSKPVTGCMSVWPRSLQLVELVFIYGNYCKRNYLSIYLFGVNVKCLSI